jgi:hypothetical protein
LMLLLLLKMMVLKRWYSLIPPLKLSLPAS